MCLGLRLFGITFVVFFCTCFRLDQLAGECFAHPARDDLELRKVIIIGDQFAFEARARRAHRLPARRNGMHFEQLPIASIATEACS